MTRIVAATRSGLVRATRSAASDWSIAPTLSGDVRCLAATPSGLFAGTQEGDILRSDDGGETWRPAGLTGRAVKSLAAGPEGAVYAGTRPAGVQVSRDGGTSWQELAPFPRLRSWWWFLAGGEAVQGLRRSNRSLAGGFRTRA